MGAALALVAELEGDADLMVLGSIASSVRQAIKFDGLLQAGESVDAAASRANVQPWKVDALRSQLKRLQPGALHRWIDKIAEADRALKGSRRTGTSVLERRNDAIIENPSDAQSTFNALASNDKELHWIEGTIARFRDGYNWFGRHPEKVLSFLAKYMA